MRDIRYIMVHCTAGNQNAKASDVVAFHLRPTAKGGRGWKAPGYHYIIEADGSIVRTWPEDKISNGVKGYNSVSINICYTGGVDLDKPGRPPIDNRTPQQKAAMYSLLKRLKKKYPDAEIHSHRDFANKACPSFDATKEYAGL